MFSAVVLGLFCALASASISSPEPLIVGSVGDEELTSPWAVAVRESTLYFSNFGAPDDAVDFIASANVDGSASKVVTRLSDVAHKPSEVLDAMHVKAIAAKPTDGVLYAAAYGGLGGSAIITCTDGASCRVLVYIEEGMSLLPSAVAYSASAERVFYALADGNLKNSVIYSVATSGGQPVEFVKQSDSTGTAAPVGLAVDDTNNHLYWSNGAGPDLIQRATFDSSGKASEIGTLLTDKDFHPHALAIDVKAKYLYFTDQTSHSIGRADLYEVNVAEKLYDEDSAMPHGIALDFEGKRVVWAETGQSRIMAAGVADLGVERARSAGSRVALTLGAALVSAMAVLMM